MIDQAVTELTPLVGVRHGCAAVREAQARWYRRHRQGPPPPKPERVPAPQPRALSEVERKELRRVLNSEEHVDDAPARDAGETGLSGWNIHVYSGTNEVTGSPVTTNGSGNYSISLNPGTYTVCEEITDHTGWVQSYPTDSTADSASCTALGGGMLAARGWSVTVVSQGTTSLRDFGNTPLSRINVDFLPQAKLPDGTTDATHATSITCTPRGWEHRQQQLHQLEPEVRERRSPARSRTSTRDPMRR